MWRAIRYGLSGELIDLERGESVPARARLERAARVGAAGRRRDRRGATGSRLPEQNAAERQIARFEEGATWPRSTASSSSPRARRPAALDQQAAEPVGLRAGAQRCAA